MPTFRSSGVATAPRLRTTKKLRCVARLAPAHPRAALCLYDADPACPPVPLSLSAMRAALIFVLALGFVAQVSAECANACSGHGVCLNSDQCDCFPNFNGNDCSERKAPGAGCV